MRCAVIAPDCMFLIHLHVELLVGFVTVDTSLLFIISRMVDQVVISHASRAADFVGAMLPLVGESAALEAPHNFDSVEYFAFAPFNVHSSDFHKLLVFVWVHFRDDVLLSRL